MKREIFFLFFFFCLTGGAAGADVVTLKDGTRYEGDVVYEGEEKVHLKMPIGIIKFRRDEIARIDKISVEPVKPAIEEEPLPFPAKGAAASPVKKPVKTAPVKKAPEKPILKPSEEWPAEIPEDAPEEISTEEPVPDEKQKALEIKEKELELKRQELELRRQELELRKKNQEEKAAEPAKPPVKELLEIKKAPEPVEEEKAKKEKSAEEEELEMEEKAREERKIKGVPVGPEIKGSGAERYKTY